MQKTNPLNIQLQETLERRILHGLSCEWDAALWVLKPEERALLRKPLISIRDLHSRWGYWSGQKKELCLSRGLVLNHPWDAVREVLLHEIAHQFTEQVLGVHKETYHGPSFQKACHRLRANPKASGNFKPLWERISGNEMDETDKLLLRVKKLLALAQSHNRHEADAAMLKAHELIAKYNLNLFSEGQNRNFFSVFVGSPALRHHREEYHLAHLLQDFYFVQGIWVSAYVLNKMKLGRVLEISGTKQNIQIASYVYDFVRHFIQSQWESFNSSRKLNRYRKTDFAIGIIEGFRSKLEGKRVLLTEQKEQLALIKLEDPLLSKYIAYKYPHTVTYSRYISTQDESIIKAGRKLGKELVISKGITEKGTGKKFLK